METATDPLARVSRRQYDTADQLLKAISPSGRVMRYDYDQVNRFKRLRHVNASSVTLEDLQYEFNLDDEINKITSLASAPLTPQSKMVSTGDAANRIGQFGSATLGFDAQGQTAAKTDVSGTSAYQWDARGRLTQVTLPNGQAVSYVYDVLGRRVSRTASGSTAMFQYDGADVVIDRVSGGSDLDYLNGLGFDDKLRQSGGSWGTLYFLQDHLSSTTALVGTGGGLVEPQQQYEAFGANAGSMRTRYGYTGREQDELTGLMHYRARWYDPLQGRFLSQDPMGFEDGYNLYPYVRNNPVNAADPLGLKTYNCIRPLKGKPGTDSGRRIGPDIDFNPLYHQYICIERNGQYYCSGMGPSGSNIVWSPGTEYHDGFSKSNCDEIEPDNDCLEQCLLKNSRSQDLNTVSDHKLPIARNG